MRTTLKQKVQLINRFNIRSIFILPLINPLTVLLIISGTVNVSESADLYEFTPDTIISSAEMNANFQALNARIQDLEEQIAELNTKLAGVSRDGDNLTFRGMNVYINNGTGTTYGAGNRLGNLIVGYNESRPSKIDNVRTGSHNIVVGVENNYSSFSGFVAGAHNAIADEYASVSGGENNIAAGRFSSVTGGYGNEAIADWSSVSGGTSNFTRGDGSTVSGGENNETHEYNATVSGGKGNHAYARWSTIGGGCSINYSPMSDCDWYGGCLANWGDPGGKVCD